MTDSLISVPELAEALASPEPPTVLDIRFRLAGPPTRRLPRIVIEQPRSAQMRTMRIRSSRERGRTTPWGSI